MADLKILFPNFSYVSEFNGGGWQSGDLSLQALLDPVLKHVARSIDTDPDNTQYVMKMDRLRQIGGVALIGHNISLGGLIKVELARDAAFSDGLAIYNFPAYPRLYHSMDLPWTAPNWWLGRPLQEDIANTTTNAISIFPEAVTCRYVRVSINDTDNLNGYIDIGKFFAGPVFAAPHNYRPDAQFTIVDNSRITESYGGTRYFDRRGKRRRMVFGFDMMNESEQFARFFDFVSKAGITEELFLVPDSDDLTNLQRKSFCGHIAQLNPLEQVIYNRMNMNFLVEEII